MQQSTNILGQNFYKFVFFFPVEFVYFFHFPVRIYCMDNGFLFSKFFFCSKSSITCSIISTEKRKHSTTAGRKLNFFFAFWWTKNEKYFWKIFKKGWLPNNKKFQHSGKDHFGDFSFTFRWIIVARFFINFSNLI